MKILKALGRLAQALLVIVLAGMLACNLYILGARNFAGNPNPTVFGYSWAVVITGSMEPAISGNDLVVTKARESYAAGDIIMFQSGNMLVTHRIVEETPAGFRTQGDANNVADSMPVTEKDIVGKVICIIPNAGTALGWLKTPLGMLCMLLTGFLLIEVPYLLESRRNGRGKGCE